MPTVIPVGIHGAGLLPTDVNGISPLLFLPSPVSREPTVWDMPTVTVGITAFMPTVFCVPTGRQLWSASGGYADGPDIWPSA